MHTLQLVTGGGNKFIVVKQAKPELMYVNQTTAKVSKTVDREEKIGDIYDISSGQGIYQNLVDPSDLIGIYKPTIVNIPKTSNEISGGRRLAFEELISRFLGWFIQSKALWILYLAASVGFTYALVVYFDALVKSVDSYLFDTDLQVLLIAGATLISAYTLFRISIQIVIRATL